MLLAYNDSLGRLGCRLPRRERSSHPHSSPLASLALCRTWCGAQPSCTSDARSQGWKPMPKEAEGCQDCWLKATCLGCGGGNKAIGAEDSRKRKMGSGGENNDPFSDAAPSSSLGFFDDLTAWIWDSSCKRTRSDPQAHRTSVYRPVPPSGHPCRWQGTAAQIATTRAAPKCETQNPAIIRH